MENAQKNICYIKKMKLKKMTYSDISEVDVMVDLPNTKKRQSKKVYKINKKGGETEA